MRIAVCLDTSLGGLTPRAHEGWAPTDQGGSTWLTDPDRYVIEAADTLREDGDEVIGIAVVPPSAATVLREALALGLDRILTIDDESDDGLDLLDLTEAIAEVLRSVEADLVLFGPQGEQSGLPLWSSVAQALGLASVSNVSRHSREGDEVTAVFQSQVGNLTVRVPVPGVMSVAPSEEQMRIVSMRDKMAARSKPIASGLAATNHGSGGTAVLLNQTDRAGQHEVRFIRDDVDAAEAVVAFLEELGLVE